MAKTIAKTGKKTGKLSAAQQAKLLSGSGTDKPAKPTGSKPAGSRPKKINRIELRRKLTQARKTRNTKAIKSVQDQLKKDPEFILVKIPIASLDGESYGQDIRSVYRIVREFRISSEAGKVLAMMMNGMIDQGCQTSGKRNVEKKEQGLQILLELIAKVVKNAKESKN